MSRFSQRLVWTMGAWLSFLSSRSPHESSIDKLSDDDLAALIRNRHTLPPAAVETGPIYAHVATTAWRIAPDAILKQAGSPTEAFMMRYVSSQTSIPIPKVRRVLGPLPGATSHSNDFGWIVMDYVEGETLKEAWPNMPWWRKLWAIWAFGRYMRQLRRVPLLNPGVPGPFDDSGKPQRCLGHCFTFDGAGPFPSCGAMIEWFNKMRFDAFAFEHLNAPVQPWTPNPKVRILEFDDTHPLVLCHMDIHLSNLLVGRDRQLWVLDWARAGAYPAWLEYVELVKWGVFKKQPDLWTKSARYTIGNYQKYWSDHIGPMGAILYGLHTHKHFPSKYLKKRGLVIRDNYVQHARSRSKTAVV